MASSTSVKTNDDRPKIVVHWLEKSRAQRLIWLLEECKVGYDIKVYKRLENHTAPPSMREIQPLGKSPILTIQAPSQPEPQVMAESGPIFEYLVDHFAPHLSPPRYKTGQEGRVCGETESWLRYRYYMHYSEGSLMSVLERKHTIGSINSADATKAINATLDNMTKAHFTFLESQLHSSPDGGAFLCGKDLTAADIIMSFPLQVVQSLGGLAAYPKLDAYVKHLSGMPAFDAAIKKVEQASGEKYVLV